MPWRRRCASTCCVAAESTPCSLNEIPCNNRKLQRPAATNSAAITNVRQETHCGFVRQIKDPAKMTHSKMALVRRDGARLDNRQVRGREGRASVTCTEDHVIMRLRCVWLSWHLQLLAATLPTCKWAGAVCLRCASNAQHAFSPWKRPSSAASTEGGWCRRSQAERR